MKVNVGCGGHYAPGWVNVDRVYNDRVRPDIVNPTGRPLLLELEHVEAIYLGHVLEHVAWEHVPGFLAECLALLEPGGEIMVVGPDTWNTLAMWKTGQASDELVRAVLEGAHPQVDGTEESWDGARHQWNADQARVTRCLTQAGFVQIVEYKAMRDIPGMWPVVAYPEWQSAVSATAP